MANAQPPPREWEPLEALDYAALGVLWAFQATTLVAVVHLLWCRHWPAYVTKNVSLVALTGLAGVLWGFAMMVGWGFIEREEGVFLADCGVDVFLNWISLGLLAASFFIRVYRLWKLLICHQGHMWPTEVQVFLLTLPFLVPNILHEVTPSDGFNYDENNCESNPSITIAMDAFLLGGMVVCLALTRQLRRVRKQFNEYRATARTLGLLMVLLISYPLVTAVLADHPTTLRRVALIYPVVTGGMLFWTPVLYAISKFVTKDEKYLEMYTHGFATLPTPKQLRASLAEKLTIEELREEFSKYTQSRYAKELVDFYKDSLDRDEVEDYFERMAVTMAIIDKYVQEGSPMEVNVSDNCRNRVLESDATRLEIFDEARSEVLKLMEDNFQREFEKTEGFQRLRRASEAEAGELKLLAQNHLVPQRVKAERRVADHPVKAPPVT